MKLIIKNDCKIISKKQLTETVFEIKYSFQKGLEWKGGQYVGITINPQYRRSYSIADYDGETLTFLIDVKPAGVASKYFRDAQIGAVNQILGPYGKFVLQETNLRKVFISTGTGIAPFLPMIRELSTKGTPFTVFSGARFVKEDIALEYIKPLMTNPGSQYIQCITREDISSHSKSDLDNEKVKLYKGRVTEILPKYSFDWENMEFYICGNPEMVNDVEEILVKLGADKIYLERY